jgi:hypothetical protein
MIPNHEVIKYNLDLLEEIKSEFQILNDYQCGKVSRESVMGIGCDDIVYFIDYIERVKSTGQKLIYDESPTFREIKTKIVDTSYSKKAKSIFRNKSKNDFIEIFKNYKTYKRYSNAANNCYTEGIEICYPIIFNFFVHNKIDTIEIHSAKYFYFKINKPILFARELQKTQEFISYFLSYAHDQDFDFRKCNIKSLTTELNFQLKKLMLIEPGYRVRSLSDSSKFLTKDVDYEVLDSRVNYLGYLEVKIVDNTGGMNYYSYSNFEERSRERDDIFKKLGI